MGITKTSAILVIACCAPASAALKYWDINGASPGAGSANPSGTWDQGSTANWSLSVAGDIATTTFAGGDTAIFSAGDDATGNYLINVATLVNPSGGLIIRNGVVTLGGAGSIGLASGTLSVTNGATVVYGASSKFLVTAGNALLLDNGTVRITNAIGTALWNATGDLRIGAGGATIEVTASGIATYSGPNGITLTPGATTAIVVKAGAGEFRPQTGAFTRLVVNQGLWRIPGTGGLETGFGAVPSLFVADAITINGGAIGTSASLTTPATRGINLGPGGATFVVSAPWTVHSVISGPGRLALNGNGFAGAPSQVLTLDGSNTYQGGTTLNLGILSIGSDSNLGEAPSNPVPNAIVLGGGTLNVNHSFNLDINRGIQITASSVIDVSAGQTLVINGAISASVATAALTKNSPGELTLGGSNSFGGGSGGDLVINGGRVNLNEDHAGGLGRVVLSPSSPITLGSTIGAVTLTNPIISNGDSPIDIVAEAGTRFALSGPITGSAGLTKRGPGVLRLTANNAYGGATAVENGLLDLGNQVGSATGTGTVTIAMTASLSGTGIATGPIFLRGTIDPGLGPGLLVTGDETWYGGANYLWEIKDAAGTAGVDWDQVKVNGTVQIISSTNAPFILSIRSLDSLNQPGPSANFDISADQHWVILSATGGISGFASEALFLDYSGFSNNIAGGRFFLAVEQGTNLVLHFQANRAPIATDDEISRPRGVGMKMRRADLLSNDTDLEMGRPFFLSVDSVSTNHAAITSDTAYVYYQPLSSGPESDVVDRFGYRVSDGFLTATGQVIVNIASDSPNPAPNLIGYALAPDGNLSVTFAGVPGRSYVLQATSSLIPPISWETLTNNLDGSTLFVAATNGLWTHVDLSSTNYAIRFYRSTIP